ncbi:MAG: transposase family protein, partial [Rhodobacteraceae bacterium]|nr:transposase family protein [Paracoccaceae bacterium]MCY3878179.1 transposase family protein [Paracoccaceae bacterium]MCY3879678.1 transposase family protein [Paracoccaceae bacterium]
MQDMAWIFEGVEDPRTSNATRHDLHEMLMIALLCVICGGRTCTDMALFGRSKEEFLRRFMKPEHGIPSHDAFSALFRIID